MSEHKSGHASVTERVADGLDLWGRLRDARGDITVFADRREAGRRLAQLLATSQFDDPLVIALPRGGVPVAFEVAAALDAPLDILVVRKLGVPWQPELGMGAVGEGGVRTFNASVIAAAGLTDADVNEVIAREETEMAQRVQRYRRARPREPVTGRTVILVDDGLATGFTARAAVDFLRREKARRIVVAVPLAPAETIAEMAELVDEVVCLEAPRGFSAVGQFYRDFTQVSDQDVADLLALSDAHGVTENVNILIDKCRLEDNLTVPDGVRGVGSGKR
jgi:putative phosphoribosyl transferase